MSGAPSTTIASRRSHRGSSAATASPVASGPVSQLARARLIMASTALAPAHTASQLPSSLVSSYISTSRCTPAALSAKPNAVRRSWYESIITPTQSALDS